MIKYNGASIKAIKYNGASISTVVQNNNVLYKQKKVITYSLTITGDVNDTSKYTINVSDLTAIPANTEITIKNISMNQELLITGDGIDWFVVVSLAGKYTFNITSDMTLNFRFS